MARATLTVSIRALTRGDWQAWRDLRLAMLAEAPQAFTLDLAEAEVRDEAAWLENIPEYPDVLFGLFHDKTLAGSAAFRRETAIKQRHKGWMLAVYVAPELRGTGWGGKLVQAVIDHARDHVDVLLTGASQQGVPVYRTHGFETFGIEPDALRVGGERITEEHMALRFR